MSIAEHRRIMDLYSKELMALSANHGLDASKLTPWSKFYFPHKESIKNHIKRRKHALDIDAVLARMPKEPQVIAPSSDDIELHYPTIQVATKSSVLGKCQALIGQMSKGNRRLYAV